jgi:hypothetical protein
MIQTILLFFAIITGLGFSVIYFFGLKFERNKERIIMCLALGLGSFPLLAIIMHLLRIPLDWRIFLLLSLIGPIYALIKNKYQINLEIFGFKRDIYAFYTLVAIALFLLVFIVFLKGSFAYPYLEDDDPWSYAMAAKYIAVEKTSWEPKGYDFMYIDPYPPSFSILMGILNQTNGSMSWTLKFFNSLIDALAILFFFFFALEITKNPEKAILGTFVLALLPSFMSHFIWSQSLAIVISIIALYCLEKIQNDKMWIIPSIITVASVLLTHVYAAIIFIGFCGVYWFIKQIFSGVNWKEQLGLFSALVGGGIVAGVYWIYVILRYGFEKTLLGVNFVLSKFTDKAVDTSGGTVYNITDFMHAPLMSKMDQPTGLGAVVFFIVIIALLLLLLNFGKLISKSYLIIILGWLVITFIGLEANMFSIKLFPHRFWAFFAIPIALLAAEGIYTLVISNKHPLQRYFILLVIIASIVWTSGYPKYVVETSQWPPGQMWTSYEEINAFVWLKTLPDNTNVFVYTGGEDSTVVGFDKFSCSWCEGVRDFRKEMMNKSLDDLYNFLLEQKYEYMVLGGLGIRDLAGRYGENVTQEHMQRLFEGIQNSTYFSVAYQTTGAIVLKVN